MKQTFESNVFVKFIPKETTEAEFRELMGRAGKIVSLKFNDFMQTSKAGVSYSNFKVGYVLYEDVSQAQRCIQLFDNFSIGFGKKPIRVDFWQSRVDLKNQAEEKNNESVKSMIQYIQ